MEGMSVAARWCSRLGAVFTMAMLTLFVPAAAWAAEHGVTDLAYEEVRRRSRSSSIFGVFGLICCLSVVAIVVIVVLLIRRGRNSRGR